MGLARLGHVLVPELITVPGTGTLVISRTLGSIFWFVVVGCQEGWVSFI